MVSQQIFKLATRVSGMFCETIQISNLYDVSVLLNNKKQHDYKHRKLADERKPLSIVVFTISSNAFYIDLKQIDCLITMGLFQKVQAIHFKSM